MVRLSIGGVGASIIVIVVLCLSTSVRAADLPAQRSLGAADLHDWNGVQPAADGAAALAVPEGQAVYRVPDGPKGWYAAGLNTFNDGTIDAIPYFGIRFEVRLDREDAAFAADWTIDRPAELGAHRTPVSTAAHIILNGPGWQTVTLPLASFDYNRGQARMLKEFKQLTVAGKYGDGKPGHVMIRNVRLVRGDSVVLDSAIRSQPGDGGAAVMYTVRITNCADQPKIFGLTIQRTGWEAMPAEVSPATMSLKPGEGADATVRVIVPANAAGGGRETQTLVVSPQGGGGRAESMQFITLKRLSGPYLIHTKPEWDTVRANATKYDWAKAQSAKIIAAADAFEVPIVPPGGINSDQGTKAVFKSYLEQKFGSVGIAFELTGNKKYAEKLALLLRRFADPTNGYPVFLHASSQGIPQEGGMLEKLCQMYDLIRDADVLSDDDKQQIERAFRLYIDWNIDGLGNGGISNWSVFNLCPAAQCALAIQDMVRFNALMDGPCGIVDHMRYGIMDDGWWYEMSLSYNLGCAQAFTSLGLAAKPFGIDYLNRRIPTALTQKVGLRPFEFENLQGMAFGKYGPIANNSITIKGMWDGITRYPDYRGVMFGMGDGHEQPLAGGAFELAYFAFRDPAYAAVIKQGSERDLIWAVPDLPTDTPTLYTQSDHSDNAGVAVLRSQTPAREPREQIQAAFKYGTHGGFHGHFDRISILSLMRYGRSFYNPETSWFGYGSYMYKWWVQTSMAHNMVVVDTKMQEPQECKLLLFYSGKMMQVVGAETTARWSNPPYFGGYEQLDQVRGGSGPFVPIPDQHPAPGEVTDYTEPVRQRRVMVVTDDYVLVADDLQAEREHTFDNLLQLRGAAIDESDRVKLIGHDAQFNASPLGSGQFVTDCNRYAVSAPAIVHSIHRIAATQPSTDGVAGDQKHFETGGAKSLSEPGVLQVDEHVLWPPRSEVVIGRYAESWNVNKKLQYDVSADGKSLASGSFGAWILGRGDVDVDVTGAKALKLSTTVDRGKNALKTVFWGSAVIVTADGKQLSLSSIATERENIVAAPAEKDYDDGRVTIAGTLVDHPIPAEPDDVKKPGVISVDLSGLNAVRFKAVVGGDWPAGDEEQVRKTVSVRSKGTSAQFVTLVEPYEDRRSVKTATATGPGQIHLELADGRIQDIEIQHLAEKSGDVSVRIREMKRGTELRNEQTSVSK